MASSLKHLVVSVTPLADRLTRWVDLQTGDKQRKAPLAQAVSVSGNGASGGPPVSGEPHARPSLSTPFVATRTETEKSITAVWEHLLGISPIGVHDKFFELGGHSLLAIQLLARLREIFELDLPVQQIFEAPTIAQLAESIDNRKKAAVSTSTIGDTKLDEMLKLVENLSDAELESLLKEADSAEQNN